MSTPTLVLNDYWSYLDRNIILPLARGISELFRDLKNGEEVKCAKRHLLGFLAAAVIFMLLFQRYIIMPVT